MKKFLFVTLLATVLAMVTATSAVAQSFSDVQGKWIVKKKSGRFGEATQTIEFKDAKFTYKVVSKDGETLLYAKGKAKVEKLGPFNVIKLTEIEGGRSESELQAVDDDRTVIYMLADDTVTIALNFDRSREGEDTECDTYTKAKN